LLPSGKLTVCYWKWPFMIFRVELPSYKMVIFHSYVNARGYNPISCCSWTNWGWCWPPFCETSPHVLSQLRIVFETFTWFAGPPKIGLSCAMELPNWPACGELVNCALVENKFISCYISYIGYKLYKLYKFIKVYISLDKFI
jgi:hypothetical protein